MSKHNGVDANTIIHALNQFYIPLIKELDTDDGLKDGVINQLKNSIDLILEHEEKAMAYEAIKTVFYDSTYRSEFELRVRKIIEKQRRGEM